MKVHDSIFDRLVSPENLFSAWEEFKKGKQKRKDVQAFEHHLEENLFTLQRELASGTYRHGSYSAFTICDPKQRQIHKAIVRDRIVHHAIFSILNPLFEPTFIAHSFSCRKNKGTHKAVDALERVLWQVSRNHTQACFVLKCDVHKFFASVDHEILLGAIAKQISDERTLALIREIVHSFHSKPDNGKGIPIGNLTSQLFANVYLNALDQFMKHTLRIKHYIRYTDDFVIVAETEDELVTLIPRIECFLHASLLLRLHPHKVNVRKYRQGIDFLGYVLLPHYCALRTKNKETYFS